MRTSATKFRNCGRARRGAVSSQIDNLDSRPRGNDCDVDDTRFRVGFAPL